MAISRFAVRNVTRGTVLAARAHGNGSFVESLRGLMFRATLGPGEALWLPGVNNIHMFFMRFPIDAVFLDGGTPDAAGQAGNAGSDDAARQRRVVAIRAAMRPWRDIVWWVRGAHGVLELPAGAAAASGTSVGDVLEFGEPVRS
jgi:uncharacterized membrane protein (UPF0127 family)